MKTLDSVMDLVVAEGSLPTGLLVDGCWLESGELLPIIDKYTQAPFASVHRARPSDVDAAVAAAVKAARVPLSSAGRSEILRQAATLLLNRRDEVIRTYVAETGFTLRDAETEVGRAYANLLLCAEEATRLTGETVPVESTPGSEGRLAFTVRIPVGVVCAITPFNAPLNNVVHKVGPAIAAGNAVVLKPASVAPLSASLLCRALVDAGLPAGFINMVVGPGGETGDQLLRDPRIRYFTFTGSTRVGLAVKQLSGVAKTHLELGSNTATIVCDDADLDAAADLIVRAGFRKAGQVCTSVQRVLVDPQVASALLTRLADRVDRLVVGDPRDAKTDVGPMISLADVSRVQEWIEEAVACGARVVRGGRSNGPVMWPTLLADVPTTARIMNDEAFAPVVAVRTFRSIDEAIAIANQTSFGLQAGVFTRNLDTAFRVARRLEVGGVIINDTSSYHADLMPFGGVKQSGYGSEGARYAVMDMTDPRIIVLNLRPPEVSDVR